MFQDPPVMPDTSDGTEPCVYYVFSCTFVPTRKLLFNQLLLTCLHWDCALSFITTHRSFVWALLPSPTHSTLVARVDSRLAWREDFFSMGFSRDFGDFMVQVPALCRLQGPSTFQSRGLFPLALRKENWLGDHLQNRWPGLLVGTSSSPRPHPVAAHVILLASVCDLSFFAFLLLFPWLNFKLRGHNFHLCIPGSLPSILHTVGAP